LLHQRRLADLARTGDGLDEATRLGQSSGERVGLPAL
jgi:hypothetical protein